MTIHIEIDCPCGHSTQFEVSERGIIQEYICENCNSHLGYLGPHYNLRFYDKKFPVNNWRVLRESVKVPPIHRSDSTWWSSTAYTYSTGSTTASWSEV